jgi:broad specificity phosphatase PhoE
MTKNNPVLAKSLKIVLVRHGRPQIALSPRTTHRGFGAYIDAYEAASLDPQSLPPQELAELGRELTVIFASDRPRSHQSAAALAPHVLATRDPLFAEAPLASPPLPFVRLNVPSWAVISRVLWHMGFAPKIEGWFAAQRRAARVADILMARARETGPVALVAHGYFNWMVGRVLKKRGFARRGSHRARYWNTVIYESVAKD